MSARRGVDTIPVQVGVRRGADRQGDLVEAGVLHIGQAEGAGVGHEGRADLVQVHHDDVGARPRGGGAHQTREQGAVELRPGIVGQRGGGRAGALVELRRQGEVRQVGDEDGPRARRGDRVDDEVDVGRSGEGHRLDRAGRVRRDGGGAHGLEDVIGAAEDADQVVGAEGSARARIGEQLIAHAGRRDLGVRASAPEGVVHAARHGRSGGEAARVEAQKLGEDHTVGESALEVGGRERIGSARRGVEVAVVTETVAEHDQAVVALGAGGGRDRAGGGHGKRGKRRIAQETRHR